MLASEDQVATARCTAWFRTLIETDFAQGDFGVSRLNLKLHATESVGGLSPLSLDNEVSACYALALFSQLAGSICMFENISFPSTFIIS